MTEEVEPKEYPYNNEWKSYEEEPPLPLEKLRDRLVERGWIRPYRAKVVEKPPEPKPKRIIAIEI